MAVKKKKQTNKQNVCGRLLFLLVLFYFISFFCVDNHLNNVTVVEEGDTFLCTKDTYLVLTEV